MQGHRLVLALSLIGGDACRRNRDAETCTTVDIAASIPPDPACDVDPCIQRCLLGDLLECCIDEHGRGLDSDATASLLQTCSESACDSEQYLSRQAAVCVAQELGIGLQAGPGTCMQSFKRVDGKYVWRVITLWDEACTEPGDIAFAGAEVFVDALSGTFAPLVLINGEVGSCD
jgi:hypothetical protein